MPRQRSRAPSSTFTSPSLSSRFAGFGEDAGLNLPALSARTNAEVLARLLSSDFDEWSTAAAKVGHCARPIRLHGSSTTVDRVSGEVLSTYSTATEPLGVLHVRCGNRRASECPSCSRVYAADTFHLIRSGVVGGKGVPETIIDNPLVFATLTAPSFGPVHGLRNDRRCRPFHTAGEAAMCAHGRSTTCHRIHAADDVTVGQPICSECYDYLGHIVWQWWAPELWRRFTITLRRGVSAHLGVTEGRLSEHATVQYAKVGEFQRRGLIHFHALIRLDGPRNDAGFAPAPNVIPADLLARLVRDAVGLVRYPAPPLFDGDTARTLAFGRQVDTRAVRTRERPDDPDTELRAEQVAGYLAKYATKSATDTCPDGTANAHLTRLRRVLSEAAAVVVEEASTCDREPLRTVPYRLLGKWTHMLGFRGHFSSKSRRYSVTLGQLRRARRRWHALVADANRAGKQLDVRDLDALLVDDDDETTLVVGHWSYAGAGWDSDGDAELAKAAASRAREYAQHRAHIRHANE
jgi:hypothetical protein